MPSIRAYVGGGAALVALGAGLAVAAEGGGSRNDYSEALASGVDAATVGQTPIKEGLVIDKLPVRNEESILFASRLAMRQAGEPADLEEPSQLNRATAICGIAAYSGVGFTNETKNTWGAARNLERSDGPADQMEGLYQKAGDLCFTAVLEPAEAGKLQELAVPFPE